MRIAGWTLAMALASARADGRWMSVPLPAATHTAMACAQSQANACFVGIARQLGSAIPVRVPERDRHQLLEWSNRLVVEVRGKKLLVFVHPDAPVRVRSLATRKVIR